MSATDPRLEITIDEVVVRGLSPAEARSTVAALEARLQVIGEEWATSNTAIVPRDEVFRRAPISTARTASPTTVGQSGASAVWASIVGGDSR